jgi:hypothetical protein
VSAKKTGNVRRDPPKKGPEGYPVPAETLKAGDVVRMTQDTLKNARWMKTSPRILALNGWPNEFHVRETFERADEGPCVELDECCLRRRDAKGDFSCGGHPMGLFEKSDVKEPEREFRPGDSRASIVVPFLGELAGYEYRADEKKAIFRIGGQPMEVQGGFADFLNDFVKKNGVA